jgi:hypothetical protein
VDSDLKGENHHCINLSCTCCRWLALLGVVLAVSRGLVAEDDPGAAVFDPELAMLEVAAHTHHLPRHWRSRRVSDTFAYLFLKKTVR